MATGHTATYSPEDNKIRIYPAHRLGKDEYDRLKSAGFAWAPQQKIFVAPAWTPCREDVALAFCGEIGDEDTSLTERAEDRAERFEGYSERRAEDAERAHSAVEAIAGNIPLGQPILVGHHSERHARRDAEKIENGMRRAVKAWETSKYWVERARGALAHAKYKELPGVRARRIKGLEADVRRIERAKKESEATIKAWKLVQGEPDPDKQYRMAMHMANHYGQGFSRRYTLAEFPRSLPISQYEGEVGLWSALGGSDGQSHAIITPAWAAERCITLNLNSIPRYDRWLAHLHNRLEYEKTMLGEQGALDLIAKKPRPAQLPLCNYRAPGGITVENMYRRGEMIHYPQEEITAAEYAKLNTNYKGTRVVGNSHRVRTMISRKAEHRSKLVCVFLTDSKVHERPADRERPTKATELAAPKPVPAPREVVEPSKFDAMRQTLKQGVKVVSAPSLFPTPEDVGRRLVMYAGVRPGMRVLEPSAGTGALVRPIVDALGGFDCGRLVTVEISSELCRGLEAQRQKWLYANETTWRILHGDFLDLARLTTYCRYDAVVMNPPFDNGTDIKHIEHALTFLKPGCKLAAICANGPRQQAAFMDRADHWEELPPGTFTGTNVRAAIVVLTAGDA